MCSGEGAENAGVLRRPVVHLHDVVQRRVEEGELAEDHWKRRSGRENCQAGSLLRFSKRFNEVSCSLEASMTPKLTVDTRRRERVNEEEKDNEGVAVGRRCKKNEGSEQRWRRHLHLLTMLCPCIVVLPE